MRDTGRGGTRREDPDVLAGRVGHQGVLVDPTPVDHAGVPLSPERRWLALAMRERGRA
jgi:hypothetical protein